MSKEYLDILTSGLSSWRSGRNISETFKRSAMKTRKTRPHTLRFIVVFASFLQLICLEMDPKILQAVKSVRDEMSVQDAAMQFDVNISTLYRLD